MTDISRLAVATTVILAVLCFSVGCVSVCPQAVPVYPVPRADKGLVYFYRESQGTGCLASYYVCKGEARIGGLKNGTYFFYWSEPGEQTFFGIGEVKFPVTIGVEAGRVYYVRGDVDLGIFAPRPVLALVSAMEGSNAIRKLTFTVLPERNMKTIKPAHDGDGKSRAR